MKPRRNYANVMATVAVFIALGGTSYAVATLPRNSVGSAQLRRGAVTSAKIKDRSVGRTDLAADTLGLGLRGPRGAEGPAGAPGGTGPRGPAGFAEILVRKHDGGVNIGFGASASVDVLTFALPAGKWFVQAVTNVINFNQGSIFRCNLLIDGSEAGPNQAIGVGNSAGTAVGALLAPAAAVDASTERQIILRCSHDAAIPAGPDLPRFEKTKITSIRVDKLDIKDV